MTKNEADEGRLPVQMVYTGDEQCMMREGRTLHRIVPRDTPAGDMVAGGWMEDDKLVDMSALIVGGSMILNGAKVRDTATVCEESEISGGAQITDNALVKRCRVSGCSFIADKAHVECSTVRGGVYIGDYAHISKSTVLDQAHIIGQAKVNKSTISDSTIVSGSAEINRCTVSGSSTITGDAVIEGLVINNLHLTMPVGAKFLDLLKFHCYQNDLMMVRGMIVGYHVHPVGEDVDQFSGRRKSVTGYRRAMWHVARHIDQQCNCKDKFKDRPGLKISQVAIHDLGRNNISDTFLLPGVCELMVNSLRVMGDAQVF